MKNQTQIIKSYKPKDLVRLIVDNSNYKDIQYNWKFIHSCDVDRNKGINEWEIKHPIYNKWETIDSLELTFIEDDTNLVTVALVSRDKIEEFIKYNSFNELIDLENYSFQIFIESDEIIINKIKIIANKETIETIYDNNKFTF